MISIKGPNGGFSINPNLVDFRLIDVVTLIDGTDIFNQCGIGLKQCSDAHPCPVHDAFKHVKEHVKNILTEKSLQELTNELRTGKTNLIEL